MNIWWQRVFEGQKVEKVEWNPFNLDKSGVIEVDLIMENDKAWRELEQVVIDVKNKQMKRIILNLDVKEERNDEDESEFVDLRLPRELLIKLSNLSFDNMPYNRSLESTKLYYEERIQWLIDVVEDLYYREKHGNW